MSNDAGDVDDDDDDEGVGMKRAGFDDSESDITPMIDMTFLLLIFFIVTSTMDPAEIGKIPRAVSGLNVPAEESAVLFLANGAGGKAVITTSEKKELSPDEDTQTSELVEFITAELDRGKKQVMLFGDAELQVGEMTRVQRVIGDAFEDLPSTYVAVQSER